MEEMYSPHLLDVVMPPCSMLECALHVIKFGSVSRLMPGLFFGRALASYIAQKCLKYANYRHPTDKKVLLDSPRRAQPATALHPRRLSPQRYVRMSKETLDIRK